MGAGIFEKAPAWALGKSAAAVGMTADANPFDPETHAIAWETWADGWSSYHRVVASPSTAD